MFFSCEILDVKRACLDIRRIVYILSNNISIIHIMYTTAKLNLASFFPYLLVGRKFKKILAV